MVNINLLPWREYQHHYEQKVIKSLLKKTIFLSLLILAMAHFFFVHQLQHMQRTLLTLKSQYELLTNQDLSIISKKQKVFSRATAGNIAILNLLKEVNERSQPSICLKTLAHHKHALTVIGVASSFADLETYLKDWQQNNARKLQINKIQSGKFPKMQFALTIS